MTMEIAKSGDEIIVKIKLETEEFDTYTNDSLGMYPNVVGVLASVFDQGIYTLNHLTYKDSTQLGSRIITTFLEPAEFRELCKELTIDVWEYPTCCLCYKTLWDSFTIIGDGTRPVCLEHIKDE